MNSGKKFELDFKNSIPNGVWYYRFRDGTASFYGGGDGSNIRFQQNNICDCLLFGNKTLFLAELKSHNGKSIPFSCIRQNQIEQMQKAAGFKFIVPLLVIFFPDVERCFAVHINDFASLVEASKKKSANVLEIEQIALEVSVNKLKSHYRYDIQKLITDLTESMD